MSIRTRALAGAFELLAQGGHDLKAERLGLADIQVGRKTDAVVLNYKSIVPVG
jgi:hypothetical protein